MTNEEHTCQFCYYEYFDGRAYPCSMCVCGEERKDMFMPKGRQNKRKTEQTERSEQMNELKRCPFCGDEVEIVPTGLYHWKYAIRHKNKTECILDANAFALPYEEEDAVRMWNTRADRKTEQTEREGE